MAILFRKDMASISVSKMLRARIRLIESRRRLTQICPRKSLRASDADVVVRRPVGFGTLGFVMSLVPQKNATGAGAAPVNVVNTSANPVPVTGDVIIGDNVPVGSPLDASGNPAPLASTDVDGPARQPFQHLVCTATIPANNTSTKCVGDSVPLGKELVVEYVTGQCIVPVGSEVLNYLVESTAITGFMESAHAPTLVGSNAIFDFYAISEKVNQYAGPGSQVLLTFGTTDTTGQTLCSLLVSGYLEAAQ